MRRLLLAIGLLAAAPAGAQTHVGRDTSGGLAWAVAAPQGASWTLACRFRPVTWEVNAYEKQRWANSFQQAGQGAARGNLPGDNGRCTLTKTGGEGPVGVALVKDGTPTAAGTADPAAPAYINVF